LKKGRSQCQLAKSWGGCVTLKKISRCDCHKNLVAFNRKPPANRIAGINPSRLASVGTKGETPCRTANKQADNQKTGKGRPQFEAIETKVLLGVTAYQ